MSHRTVTALLFLATSLLASDVTGIWVGQQQGRRGEPEDVAFRFKADGASLSGKLFGDEFDLPIADATLSGDQIRFTVTTTNYYSGRKVTDAYSGTVKGGIIELTRERIPTPEDKAASRPPVKLTLKLKRLT